MKEEIRKLDGTDPEEILTFIRMFNSKISDLEIAEGRPRLRLFKRLLGDDVKQEWSTIKENFVDQEQNQDYFEQYMRGFMLRFMSWNFSRYEGMDFRIEEAKRTVCSEIPNQDKQIHNLFQYMPTPEGEEEQT